MAIKPDAVVAKVAELAEKHDGLAVLAGLVGKGAAPDAVRLYLRPEMDWYVDFPQKAVVHHMDLPKESSLVGGSLLWVVPGTKLSEVKATAIAEQAAFMRGELTQGQFASDPAMTVAAGGVTFTVGTPGPTTITLTVIGTVIITGGLWLSYHYCATPSPLNSALMHQQCVTTNATVICHPQTVAPGAGPGPGV